VSAKEILPESREELVEALAGATGGGTGGGIRIVGGGTHTPPVPPGEDVPVRLRTAGLARVIDHTPADLTVTVEGGMRAADLAELLAGAGQCWPQADIVPGATVGGILSAAASGHRRLREGPVRDSLLEVVIATGDGRLITGGGRTVKNVSGFDIPRLTVGAHGTLGVIVQATLKLWPLPERVAWFRREGEPADLVDAARALVASPVRPGAVLLGAGGLDVELVGPAPDVIAPDGFAARAGAPEPFTAPAVMTAGVPPARLAPLAVALHEDGLRFRAAMGVGSCQVEVPDDATAMAVRERARLLGGHAVLTRDTLGLGVDRWGAAPAGMAQMMRLRRAFDPAGVLNRGLLVDEPVTGGRR
jgi:glycolate oxidase FAD binding subunit